MRNPFRKRQGPASAPLSGAAGRALDAAVPDIEVVSRLAREHLPEGVREQWLRLLRPAVQLVPLAHGQDEVGRLGGSPALPTDMPWPDWDSHGPLSFIGELRCEGLSKFELDIPIPRTGWLLFFYFDGSYDDHATTVGTWDASTLQGARAIHVSDEGTRVPRTPPDGIAVYPERVLAGRPIVTSPGWEHPDLRDAFMAPRQDHRSFMDHPVNADAFLEALHERHSGPVHQVGGYAEPVQGPVESEVAHAALGNEVAYVDPRLDVEARRWELLLQVESDDELDMMWGDVGTLYWMARPEDLAGNDLTQISFTWQCS